MKDGAIKWVWFTTFYLLVFVVLCQLNLGHLGYMSLLMVGQFLVLYMVYKVLTGYYRSDKTFKDWYGDRPMKTLDEKK